MRLTTAPEALPGSCFKCGAANREFFIDLGMSFEFHGAVYICSECVIEMSALSGFVSREEISQLVIEKEKLGTENFVLQKRIDGQGKIIDGLRTLRSIDRVDSVRGSDLDTSLDSETTSPGENNLGAGTGEDAESGDDEGMVVLSADASEPADEFKLF